MCVYYAYAIHRCYPLTTMWRPFVFCVVIQYSRTRTWTSFDDVNKLPAFKTTIRGEINELYTLLEDEFGTEVVSWFFGLLMASRDGLWSLCPKPPKLGFLLLKTAMGCGRVGVLRLSWST